jgi:hypothetical protein
VPYYFVACYAGSLPTMGMAAAASSGSAGSQLPPDVSGSKLLQMGSLPGQPQMEQQQSAQQQQQQQSEIRFGTPSAPYCTPRKLSWPQGAWRAS